MEHTEMTIIEDKLSKIKFTDFTWELPEKKQKKCPYCNCEMEAIKKSYIIMGRERYYYEYKCPNDCQRRIDLHKKYAERYKRAKEIWKKVGLSRSCIGWNINKLTCENAEILKNFAENFVKFSKSLVLLGNKGTGKTLASECIAKFLVKKGNRVKITNMTEVNIQMNKALRQDNYEGLMNDILKLDLIIIDDFGREQYTTEKSLENVFQFFNTLTKEHKPFIVSINPEILASLQQKPQLDACLDRFRDKKRVMILEFKKNSLRK